MSEQLTNDFIEALKKLEADNDTETIAALFAEEASIGNIVTPDSFTGVNGAKDFWGKYRESFGSVSSEFKNKIITEDRAALEWTTSGTTGDNNEFSYEGVSILEYEGDKIKRFFAYFDPAKLGKQITEGE